MARNSLQEWTLREWGEREATAPTLPPTGLPPATAIGQILISTDGATFTVQEFAVSDLGEIAVDDEGIVGVVG